MAAYGPDGDIGVGEIGVIEDDEGIEEVGAIEDSEENGDGIKGGATGTIGLAPALLSSEAPSGIVPPLREVSPGWPGVDSGEALPGVPAVIPGATALQPRENGGELDEIGVPPESPAVPPPSNVELDRGVPTPMTLDPDDPVVGAAVALTPTEAPEGVGIPPMPPVTTPIVVPLE